MQNGKLQRVHTLIDGLELKPHPEGGYYREVYRSAATVLPSDERGERAALTTILFLLAAGQHSRWHRVTSDEVWHFYEGEPLELFWIDPSGTTCRRDLLGSAGEGCLPVRVVPAGCWQAARPTGTYTLAGCTVAPGFDFADFEMLAEIPGAADVFRQHFPDMAELI